MERVYVVTGEAVGTETLLGVYVNLENAMCAAEDNADAYEKDALALTPVSTIRYAADPTRPVPLEDVATAPAVSEPAEFAEPTGHSISDIAGPRAGQSQLKSSPVANTILA